MIFSSDTCTTICQKMEFWSFTHTHSTSDVSFLSVKALTVDCRIFPLACWGQSDLSPEEPLHLQENERKTCYFSYLCKFPSANCYPSLARVCGADRVSWEVLPWFHHDQQRASQNISGVIELVEATHRHFSWKLTKLNRLKIFIYFFDKNSDRVLDILIRIGAIIPYVTVQGSEMCQLFRMSILVFPISDSVHLIGYILWNSFFIFWIFW